VIKSTCKYNKNDDQDNYNGNKVIGIRKE